MKILIRSSNGSFACHCGCDDLLYAGWSQGGFYVIEVPPIPSDVVPLNWVVFGLTSDTDDETLL